MSTVWRAQHQLDHLPGVEVAADEFAVRWEFFEGGDGEVMRLHYRVAHGSDAFKEVLSVGGGEAWEGLDEEDAGVGLLVASVDTLDA